MWQKNKFILSMYQDESPARKTNLFHAFAFSLFVILSCLSLFSHGHSVLICCLMIWGSQQISAGRIYPVAQLHLHDHLAAAFLNIMFCLPSVHRCCCIACPLPLRINTHCFQIHQLHYCMSHSVSGESSATTTSVLTPWGDFYLKDQKIISL